MTEQQMQSLLVNDAEAAAYMQDVRDWIGGLLATPRESLMPYLVIKTKDRPEEVTTTICAIAADFNEHDEKHALINRLGQKFYANKTIPVFVALASEAWRAEYPAGAEHVEPRHHPGRVEVVHVVGRAFGPKACWHTAMLIGRDAANMIVPGAWEDITPVESPLLDSFYRGFFKLTIERLN
jgi:hypothetical protein